MGWDSPPGQPTHTMGTGRHRSWRPDSWLPFVQTVSIRCLCHRRHRQSPCGPWGHGASYRAREDVGTKLPPGRAGRAAVGRSAPAWAGPLRRPASSRRKLRVARPLPPAPEASAAGPPPDARSPSLLLASAYAVALARGRGAPSAPRDARPPPTLTGRCRGNQPLPAPVEKARRGEGRRLREQPGLDGSARPGAMAVACGERPRL